MLKKILSTVIIAGSSRGASIGRDRLRTHNGMGSGVLVGFLLSLLSGSSLFLWVFVLKVPAFSYRGCHGETKALTKHVPRIELDHRACDARKRLVQMEQLLVSRCVTNFLNRLPVCSAIPRTR